MITVTAFKWVPAFAQGQVRDLRARWALEEAGLAYQVRLIDAHDQRAPEYRARQPFGQVPVLEEDGRSLFESGAIVLHVAGRGGDLLPADVHERALTISWLFAALNTVEIPLGNLAEADFFLPDADRARRRAQVLPMVEQRLGDLAAALGRREHLVGDRFTAADLMMSTVLRILDHTDILAGHETLCAYKARCEARPAFRRALEGQLADFAANEPD